MSALVSRLKTFKPIQLGSLAFYALTGLLLLVFLPFTGFPPHMGFMGILSLITAYSLLMKRFWAPWLVAFMFVIITVFTLDILLSVGFSDILVGLSMLGYAVFTWLFTAISFLKR
jgi:uncharacterized membrane protein YfhO